jgi:hypothetical protein
MTPVWITRKPGSPGAAQLYDRRAEEVTLDEVERVII